MRSITRRSAGLLGLAALGAPLAARAGDRPIGQAFAGRSAVIARAGMVATSQPLATQAGVRVLQAGGSAVDAAIAANACLALMEPTGCGLGGDLFAILWDPASRKLHGINASGPAPMGETLEGFRRRARGASIVPFASTAAVTVPGAVDGWLELSQRFGRLPLADVLQPAIVYARDGFPVSPVIADGWRRNMARLAEQTTLEEFDNAKRTYAPNGATPPSGALFKNNDLSATLTNIALFGRAYFYEGEAARVIDAYMRRIGGALRADDMARYRAEWVDPVGVDYRGHRVFQIPPNGQGIAGLQMLNILEGFDLKGWGFGHPDALHAMIEAKKLAFADRARFIADPRFAPAPLERLLSKDYAAERRRLIDMDRARQAQDVPAMDRGDTIYLCAADESGMMVSLIQSNYRGMGSGLVPDGLGFMLQNRGAQFNLNPAHPNVFAPGKRPFHTIIPGFAMKGEEPWLAFGVMGGSMQPQGHVQVLTSMIDYGMDPQEAGDAPRWRHLGGPDPDGAGGGETGDQVFLETGFALDVRAALAAKGHRLTDRREDVGGYQAIQRAGGVYVGASEMRKDGQAAGF